MNEFPYKHILVSGANGYLASSLIAHALKLNCRITCLVRSKLVPRRSPGASRIRWVDAVELDMNPSVVFMADDGSDQPVDAVFHLATKYLPDGLSNNRAQMWDSNYEFGIKLFEAATACGVKAFINAGTYWECQAVPPLNYYTKTKELYSQFLVSQSGKTNIKIQNLRLFDVIGPHDPRQKLLTQLIQAQSDQRPFPTTMGEQPIFPIYVEDVVEGLIHAATAVSNFTVGTSYERYDLRGRQHTVKDFICNWLSIYESDLEIQWGLVPYKDDQIFDVHLLDVLPGWQAKTPLAKALAMIRDAEGKQIL